MGFGFSLCARMLDELTMSLSPFFSSLSVPNNAASDSVKWMMSSLLKLTRVKFREECCLWLRELWRRKRPKGRRQTPRYSLCTSPLHRWRRNVCGFRPSFGFCQPQLHTKPSPAIFWQTGWIIQLFTIVHLGSWWIF